MRTDWARLVLALIAALSASQIGAGLALALPPPTGRESALGRMYRDADLGLSLRYSPYEGTYFRAVGDVPELNEYERVIGRAAREGTSVTLGVITPMFDFNYSVERSLHELGAWADLTDAGLGSVYVRDLDYSVHTLSISRPVSLGYWRLFVNLGWGLSTGKLEFNQVSAIGVESRSVKSSRSLFLIYEPMLEVATWEQQGFNLSLSYSGHLPVIYGGDFFTKSHGPALVLVTTWSR